MNKKRERGFVGPLKVLKAGVLTVWSRNELRSTDSINHPIGMRN
jgi:hypothetical protein